MDRNIAAESEHSTSRKKYVVLENRCKLLEEEKRACLDEVRSREAHWSEKWKRERENHEGMIAMARELRKSLADVSVQCEDLQRRVQAKDTKRTMEHGSMERLRNEVARRIELEGLYRAEQERCAFLMRKIMNEDATMLETEEEHKTASPIVKRLSFRSSPLRSSPVRSSPLRSSPLRSSSPHRSPSTRSPRGADSSGIRAHHLAARRRRQHF